MRQAPGNVMQFGRVVRGTCLLLLVGVAAALAVASMRRGPDAAALTAFLALALVMLGAGTVEVFGVAHRLVPGGIERVAPGRRRALVRWEDVVAVEWIPSARWYELTSRDGVRIRVYQQLNGIASFARAVLDGVPARVIDGRPDLRRHLERSSRGQPLPDDSDREAWRGP